MTTELDYEFTADEFAEEEMYLERVETELEEDRAKYVEDNVALLRFYHSQVL